MEDEIELIQMIYLLDIKNYDKEIDDFRKEYISYKDTKIYLISPDFKDFSNNLVLIQKKIILKKQKDYVLYKNIKIQIRILNMGGIQ